jgi:hypothetical protein
MRLQDLSANYPPRIERELLVPTPGKACRPRPILLLDRKLQSDSNFLMSSDFSFLFRMSLMCSAAAAITGGMVTLASIDDHRERLKLIWSFSEAADSM